MVRSIDPRRETIRGAQRYSDTAAVFGARVAETISASGHGRPHQQAGHMTASDPIKTPRPLLQARGRPHMGAGRHRPLDRRARRARGRAHRARDAARRRCTWTAPATSPASVAAVRARRRHRARPPRRSCAATRRRAPTASRPATCRRSSSRAPTCRGCSRPPRRARPDAAAAVARARRRPPRRRRLRPKPGGPLPVLELDAPARRAARPRRSRGRGRTRRSAGSPPAPGPPTCSPRDPGRACSRLVCARAACEPDTAYLACLVPAFLAGVKAGLGEPVTATTRPAWSPAWSRDADRRRCGCRSTTRGSSPPGPRGASRRSSGELHPSPLDPTVGAAAEARPRARPAAGCRPPASIGCRARSRARPGRRRRRGRTRHACRSRRRSSGCSTRAPPDVLAPPVYGQVQAGASALPAAGGQPDWLRELNLDPRLRVAAAAGTRVVQERQEQLMARAWEQAGAVDDANALLRRSQLARELGSVVLERHLAPLAGARAAGDDAARARADRSSPSATVDERAAGQPRARRPWCRARCAGSPARRALIARRAALAASPVDTARRGRPGRR